LAVEAETSVALVAAVSAAAGKLAAAAMPPAIRTLRREARAGVWSFNRESSWLVCVGSFKQHAGRSSVPDQTTLISRGLGLRERG
jgi:hypothetical protein